MQDDWRARSNLTINLGLRFEHETPTIERHDQAVNGFDPNATNPVSALAAAAYAANPIPQIPANQFRALGGLTFASAARREIYQSNSHIFSPRFGIAWTPKALNSKYVLRAGFGVFVSPLGTTGLNSPGFSQTTQMAVTNNNYLSPLTTLSDPFPNGILSPSGASLGAGPSWATGPLQSAGPEHLFHALGRQHPTELPGQLVEVATSATIPCTYRLRPRSWFHPQQYLSRSPSATMRSSTYSRERAQPFKGLLPNSTALNGRRYR